MMHPIIEKIEAFTDGGDWSVLMAGYTFDHIVLGDINLGDRDIEFCLSNDVILGWLELQIKTYREMVESDMPMDTLYWHTLLIEAGKIAAFLHELWRIPEAERVAAEEDYNDPA